jgi:hypothetical protein
MNYFLRAFSLIPTAWSDYSLLGRREAVQIMLPNVQDDWFLRCPESASRPGMHFRGLVCSSMGSEYLGPDINAYCFRIQFQDTKLESIRIQQMSTVMMVLRSGYRRVWKLSRLQTRQSGFDTTEKRLPEVVGIPETTNTADQPGFDTATLRIA